MSTEKTSELIRRKVNVHGELHLDAQLTALLLRLIEADEKFLDGTMREFEQLRELLKPLLKDPGSDAT